MAFGNSFDLKAVLSADISNFERGMKQASNAMKDFQNNTKGLSQVADGMKSVGKTMTAAFTVPFVAGMGASVKAAADYETALVGVGKTTDITGEELRSLGKEFQNMAREVPVATNELLSIGESAGQLGIEKKNILDFTETIAQISVATNMTSEQAANDFARLANITQMPQTEFDRLGSVIVELGNNMATTESEITAIGLRLAGTGAQVGLTEAQIMALAASMSSVGIEAQAGGSAFSRVMQKMNTEVLSGGDNLEKFASIAGLSAEEFAEKWQTNPPEAITDFVNGLGRVSETGGDVTATLQELGINSVNEIDTLSRLAGAGDLLTESFEMAGNAWERNTALSKEAEQAFGTFKSSMQLLKNAFVEVGVTIGEMLAPYIQQLAEYIMSAVNAFNDASPAIQMLVVVIGALVAAIGPVIFVVGTLITWFFKVKVAVTMLLPLFSGLGMAFVIMAAKIIAVIAVISALIAAGVWLYQNWDTVREKAIAIWSAITSYLSSVWQSIKNQASAIWSSITQVMSNNWNIVRNFTISIWNSIRSMLSGIWNGIRSQATSIFNSIRTVVTSIWNGIRSITSSVWNGIRSLITSILNGIRSTFTSIFNSLRGIVSNAFSSVRSAVMSGMRSALSAVTSFFGRFRSAGSNIVSNIASGIRGAVGKVRSAMKGVLSAARNLLPFSPPKDKSSPLVDIHKNGIVEQIAKGITNNAGDLERAASSALNGVQSALNAQSLDASLGLDSALARANTQVNGNVRHEVGKLDVAQRPAYINLSIGGQQFTAFVENISNEQGRLTDLDMQF